MATELTWLGHAAFRVDTPGDKRIYVDPFLTGNPRCPPTFPLLSGTPEALRELAPPGVEIPAPEPGETLTF